MSFPIRTVHLPSPLHQRCFPSPPPSETGEHIFSISTPRSPSDNRRSIELAYFPVVTNVPASNDSSAVRTITCQPTQVTQARVVLAWAIIRLRHPILSSVGLMDPFGKVSYSYDPPANVDAAIFDAEASLEPRRNVSALDLLASYKSGTRRVSRSHLSHLLFSSSPAMISPPPTPPLPNRGTRPVTLSEFSFLLCTPHYVANNKALDCYLEELVALLIQDTSEIDLQKVLESEWKVSASKQPPTMTLKPITAPGHKMKLPREGRFLRTVAAS